MLVMSMLNKRITYLLTYLLTYVKRIAYVINMTLSRRMLFVNCMVKISFILSARASVSFQLELRYDTIRVYLTCSKKLTCSQLSPPHGTNKKLKRETKNEKMSIIGPVQSRCHEGSPVQKKSKVRRICWKGRFWVRGERVKEWWMMRVVMIIEMSWQVNEEVSRDITGEADGMNQGVDSRDGVMHYLNERSVIFNEEMVGGRKRVTIDKDRVLRGGWTEIRLLR